MDRKWLKKVQGETNEMVRRKKVSTIGYAPEGGVLSQESQGVSKPVEYSLGFLRGVSFLL